MKTRLIAAALLVAASTTAANAAKVTHPVKATAKSAPLVCPITGDKIASAKAAYDHETYKGKTYYFCCPMCQPQFDKNRAAAVANAAKGKYHNM